MKLYQLSAGALAAFVFYSCSAAAQGSYSLKPGISGQALLSAGVTPCAFPGARASCPRPDADGVGRERSLVYCTGGRPAAAAFPGARHTFGFSRGVIHLRSGSVLKVQLLTELDTRMVEVGDRVEAKLLENVSDNGIVIARFGDLLEGWISSLEQSRRAIIAKWPSRSWLNANAAMGIYFHQILRGDGKVLKFQASLAPQTMLTAGERQGVALATNKHGKLTVYFPALKYAAASLAIEGAGYASGPFKPVAGPVISAAVGAVHPPYAYDSPVPESEPHKRLKGFLKGAVKGLPGGFIITGVVNHGREICIHEGTELDVALESDLSMQIPEQKIAQAP